MKKIECIISNTKFPELERALRNVGIPGMTVSDVRGYGNEQTRPESYLFLPKTRIEIYCNDEDIDRIVDTIFNICQTSQLGSGKIAIYEIQELIRIRTGERGEVAV